MNKRIKELAEQAYERQPLMVPNPETFEIEHKIGNVGVPMYHRVFNQEKFAELIVQECFSKLTPYMDDQFIGDIESEIKEHFGIEV
jgi:hypothetical protein